MKPPLGGISSGNTCAVREEGAMREELTEDAGKHAHREHELLRRIQEDGLVSPIC